MQRTNQYSTQLFFFTFTTAMLITTIAHAILLRPMQRVIRPTLLRSLTKAKQTQPKSAVRHFGTDHECIIKTRMGVVKDCAMMSAICGGIIGGGIQKYGGLEWVDKAQAPWWLLQAPGGIEIIYGSVYGGMLGLGTLSLTHMYHTAQKRYQRPSSTHPKPSNPNEKLDNNFQHLRGNHN